MTEYIIDSQLGTILSKLLKEAQLTEAKLSRLVNLPPATINRITNGVIIDPKLSTLTKLADFFQITVDQLVGRSDLESKTITNLQIPLFELDELNQYINQSDFSQISHHQWISFESETPSNSLFALTVAGDAMYPYLDNNSTIVVNTAIKPKHRSFVVAYLHESKNILIRTLLVDGNTNILKAIDSSFSDIVLTKDDKILGEIIHVKKNFTS